MGMNPSNGTTVSMTNTNRNGLNLAIGTMATSTIRVGVFELVGRAGEEGRITVGILVLMEELISTLYQTKEMKIIGEGGKKNTSPVIRMGLERSSMAGKLALVNGGAFGWMNIWTGARGGGFVLGRIEGAITT